MYEVKGITGLTVLLPKSSFQAKNNKLSCLSRACISKRLHMQISTSASAV